MFILTVKQPLISCSLCTADLQKRVVAARHTNAPLMAAALGSDQVISLWGVTGDETEQLIVFADVM